MIATVNNAIITIIISVSCSTLNPKALSATYVCMYVCTAQPQLSVQEADGGGLKDTDEGSFQGLDFRVQGLELRA